MNKPALGLVEGPAICSFFVKAFKQTKLAALVYISWSRTANSPSTSARRRARPRLPLPPLPPRSPPPQCPPKRKRPRRQPSNSVTGTGGVRAPPGNHCKTTHPNRKIEMSVSTSSSTPNPPRCKDVRRRCRDHWKRQAELKNRARNVAPCRSRNP
jgi:hypothetical protein